MVPHVEGYAEQQLTFEKDRLPAIAGLAKRVSELTGYTYKAGLCAEDLVRGLAWCLDPIPIPKPPPVGFTVPRAITV